MDSDLLSFVLDPNIFDYESLNIFKGFHLSHPDVYKLALVITYHPNILKKFTEKQHLITSFPYKYPKRRTPEAIYQFQYNLDTEVRQTVDSFTKELMNDLRLTSNWEISIFMKLTTNVLPIPHDNPKFVFVEPDLKILGLENTLEESNNAKSLRDLTKPSALKTAMKIMHRLENAAYPHIVIKEKLTQKGELIKFITENFDSVIKPATSLLPSRKNRRADLERFCLSVYLFDLRINKGLMPKQICKIIDELNKGEKIFKGFDTTGPGISKLIDEAKVKFNAIYPL